MQAVTDITLRAREAELDRIIRDAMAEKDEIAIVKRFLARMNQEGSASPPAVVANETAVKEPPTVNVEIYSSIPFQSRDKAIGVGDAIEAVLKASQIPWMTSREIQVAASGIAGRDIPLSSIRPKITEMTSKGFLVRRDKHVALSSRAKPNPTGADIERERQIKELIG